MRTTCPPPGFSDLPTALELRIGSEGFFVVNSFEGKFKDSLFVSNIIKVKSFENRYSKYIDNKFSSIEKKIETQVCMSN